jgi:hypothetical protein
MKVNNYLHNRSKDKDRKNELFSFFTENSVFFCLNLLPWYKFWSTSKRTVLNLSVFITEYLILGVWKRFSAHVEAVL